MDQESMIIIEVYVDDIMFGSDADKMNHNCVKDMQIDFEMSFLRELTLYLRLQISQMYDGFFISQTKYIKEILKKLEWKTANL